MTSRNVFMGTAKKPFSRGVSDAKNSLLLSSRGMESHPAPIDCLIDSLGQKFRSTMKTLSSGPLKHKRVTNIEYRILTIELSIQKQKHSSLLFVKQITFSFYRPKSKKHEFCQPPSPLGGQQMFTILVPTKFLPTIFHLNQT